MPIWRRIGQLESCPGERRAGREAATAIRGIAEVLGRGPHSRRGHARTSRVRCAIGGSREQARTSRWVGEGRGCVGGGGEEGREKRDQGTGVETRAAVGVILISLTSTRFAGRASCCWFCHRQPPPLLLPPYLPLSLPACVRCHHCTRHSLPLTCPFRQPIKC